MDEELFASYGLKRDYRFKAGAFPGFTDQGSQYIVIPAEQLSDDELQEIKQVSESFLQMGEWSTGRLVLSRKQQLSERIAGHQSILVQYPLKLYQPSSSLGAELSRFHQLGRMVPQQLTHLNRYGNWKDYWIERLDYHTTRYERVKEKQEYRFDERFSFAFFYFSGLAENAIQYIVDAEYDGQKGQFDGGTICYRRFSRDSWLMNGLVKLPHDWVYDHSTRDVAEWIRDKVLTSNFAHQTEVKTFLNDYNRATPLSAYGWRMIYGRLLFPLHFFEAVERFDASQTDQERDYYTSKLDWIIESTPTYEQFLNGFHQMMGMRDLPELDWIKNRNRHQVKSY